MKFLSFISQYGLRLIIAVFFIVALAGIFNDYSLNTGGDETVLMAASIKMIAEKTLRPAYETFYHVPFGVYFYLTPFILLFLALRLSGVFTDFNSLKEFVIIDYQKLLPFARLLSVIMAAVSIYLLYKIAQKLFNNKWLSLLASFFLAFSLMFVQVAHLGRVWMPQVMTILAAFYLIVVLCQRQENKVKDYLLAGLGVGLAMGTHVVGVFVYASFFAAHYLKNSTKKIKDILLNRHFWLANLAIAACYFLVMYLNPYGFKNYINREGGVSPKVGHLFDQSYNLNFGLDQNAGLLKDTFDKLIFYPRALFEHEPLLVLIAIYGFVLLFRRERKIFILITAFIFFYYLGVSFIGWEPRYILPAVPFFALAASYGAVYAYEKLNKKSVSIALAAVMAIIFIMPLAWDYRVIQPSNRLSAIKWVYNNLPAGTRIINFDPLFELNESQETMSDIRRYVPGYETKKRSFLLSKPETELKQPNYYILYPSYFSEPPKELTGKKYDYLIFFWNKQSEFKYYQDLAKDLKLNLSLVKRFPESASENSQAIEMNGDMKRPIYAIFKMTRGPIIDIYKIK